MVRQALTIAAMALACLGLVGCGDQYGAYQPDPTPMAAVVATAVATATSDIQAPASDAVQFCAFDGYDAGAVRCLRPDASYDHSTDPGATERAVWPA